MGVLAKFKILLLRAQYTIGWCLAFMGLTLMLGAELKYLELKVKAKA